MAFLWFSISLVVAYLASEIYKRLTEAQKRLRDVELDHGLLKERESKLLAERSLLRPELDALRKVTTEVKAELSRYLPEIERLKGLEAIEQKLSNEEAKLGRLKAESEILKKDVDLLVVHRELTESGFFHYRYAFEDVVKYREALLALKASEKAMFKTGRVFQCGVPELVGTPMMKGLSKLAFLAFHAECELVVEHVTSTNMQSSSGKITSIFSEVNKHLSQFQAAISDDYLALKLKELQIGFEFDLEMQKIREEQIAFRNEAKDEEDARVESEEIREKAIEAEEAHAKVLEQVRRELAVSSDAEKAAIQKRCDEAEAKYNRLREETERAVSNAQKTQRGHVYVISNVGSFGENVFKIGMTRRDDPEERVRELGNASVPFNFDIHAKIFSENAPALENQLHKIFDQSRMNKVNTRREFFRVRIEEIEAACREIGCEFKMSYLAEAREFKETLAISSTKKNQAA